MPEKPDPRIRLDKWLWAARFYKTRSLAAQAIEAGRARADDQRVKPSHAIKAGTQVTLRKDALVWNLEVAAVTDKRGPASEAAKMYRESPKSAVAREEEIARRRAAAASAPRTPGRPTKRDRRKLLSFLDEG
jgi:ribosome-associated heat shock protein Hsp15